MDSAYQARYLSAARLLWDASHGVPQDIPESYCEHLHHEYVDGDVSLVPLLNRFDYAEDLEDYELDEVIEMLGKVSPNDWPALEDVEVVNAEQLLHLFDTDETLDDESLTHSMNFVEDNLGTAEKVEKVLAKVIESVLGEPVENVRGAKGSFPSPENNFLQEEDGTFAGTFTHNNREYKFEVAPQESGWLCTYRLSEKGLDGLPPLLEEDKKEEDPTKKDYTRRVRNKGWS